MVSDQLQSDYTKVLGNPMQRPPFLYETSRVKVVPIFFLLLVISGLLGSGARAFGTLGHGDQTVVWNLSSMGIEQLYEGLGNLEEVHSIQGETIDDFEVKLRKLATLRDAGSQELSLLLEGSLQLDAWLGECVWIPSHLEHGEAGLPLQRVVKYASGLDPDFHLSAIFQVELSEMDNVYGALQSLLANGGLPEDSVLLLRPSFVDEPGGEEMEESLQIRLLRLMLKGDPVTVEELLREQNGGMRLIWSSGENTFDRSKSIDTADSRPQVAPATGNANKANREENVPMSKALEKAELLDLNFDRKGIRFSAHRSTALQLELNSSMNSLDASLMAINGYSVDLLGEPLHYFEFRNDGDSIQQQEDPGGRAPEGLIWVMWLLPNHLGGSVFTIPVMRMPASGERGSSLGEVWLVREETDGPLFLEAYPGIVGGVDTQEHQSRILLVPGVWNLVALCLENEGARTQVQRLYPAQMVPNRMWTPVYGFGREAANVCAALEKPVVMLDSIRAFSGNNPSDLRYLESERYDRFQVSKLTYSEIQDLEKSILRESGGKTVLADWENLKACFNGEGDRMVQILDLEIDEGFLVKRYGERFFKKGRHYFFNRFDHRPREAFLVHDEIENHLISLGSWSRLYLKAICEVISDDVDN